MCIIFKIALIKWQRLELQILLIPATIFIFRMDFKSVKSYIIYQEQHKLQRFRWIT